MARGKMNTLKQLLNFYGSDKEHRHGYAKAYEEMLGPMRESARYVVELGVLEGASLRAWRDWFTQAKIIGVDVEPAIDIHEDDRIQCLIFDLCESESWA